MKTILTVLLLVSFGARAADREALIFTGAHAQIGTVLQASQVLYVLFNTPCETDPGMFAGWEVNYGRGCWAPLENGRFIFDAPSLGAHQGELPLSMLPMGLLHDDGTITVTRIGGSAVDVLRQQMEQMQQRLQQRP